MTMTKTERIIERDVSDAYKRWLDYGDVLYLYCGDISDRRFGTRLPCEKGALAIYRTLVADAGYLAMVETETRY